MIYFQTKFIALVKFVNIRHDSSTFVTTSKNSSRVRPLVVRLVFFSMLHREPNSTISFSGDEAQAGANLAWHNLFFLMYAQIPLVTSVRGRVFLPPQMAASDSDKLFGAKMPLPAFFIASARAAPAAFCAAVACFFTGFPVAFEIFGPVVFAVFVVFVVTAFAIVVFVVVVMSAGE